MTFTKVCDIMKNELRRCPVKETLVYISTCEKRCYKVKCEFAKKENRTIDRRGAREAEKSSI